MRVHSLKTHRGPFEEIITGFKRAEFRKNDRNFAKFDVLHLREWDGGEYSGRSVVAMVSSVCQGYGIPDGYVMMSILLEDDRGFSLHEDKQMRP